MQWLAQAPSNIALIKYMGKSNEAHNIAANPSLSFTLDHLRSSVVLEEHSGNEDIWEPLQTPGAIPFTLPEAAQKRFLDHLNRVKQHFHYHGYFVVRSCNNFPHSSGLASSASSFAALTKCAAAAICDLQNHTLPPTSELAKLSMQGSGSSCRSFFSPWAIWKDDTIMAVETHWMHLEHQVIILSSAEKQVSSSEAHRRVLTSPHWQERQESVQANFRSLAKALTEGDWKQCREICWKEFHEMHHLFATAQNPFHYITREVQEVLDLLQGLWEEKQDGPIVTMDAGPNIHLLFRPDQARLAMQMKDDHFLGNYDVL